MDQVPRWRVLVADEDDQLRTGYGRFLGEDGRFEVVALAGDGAEVLWMAAATLPDLVLLGEDVAVLDAVRVLPYLRRAAPGALVAVTSSSPTEEAARAARGAGAAAYLAKPAAAADLGDRILESCERRVGERRTADRRREDRRRGLRDRRGRSRGGDRRQRARRQAERRLGDRRQGAVHLPGS